MRPVTSRILHRVYVEHVAEAPEPESRLLNEIRKFRENFPAKYNRRMTEEEKRILDYAEKLLEPSAAKKQVTGA